MLNGASSYKCSRMRLRNLAQKKRGAILVQGLVIRSGKENNKNYQQPRGRPHPRPRPTPSPTTRMRQHHLVQKRRGVCGWRIRNKNRCRHRRTRPMALFARPMALFHCCLWVFALLECCGVGTVRDSDSTIFGHLLYRWALT